MVAIPSALLGGATVLQADVNKGETTNPILARNGEENLSSTFFKVAKPHFVTNSVCVICASFICAHLWGNLL